MKQYRLVILCFGLLIVAGPLRSPAFAQDADAPRYRSRAELVAARRNLEQTFPETVRALRTSRLSPDKLNEAEGKLRRSEAATRVARQELQLIEDENQRQGYNREARSARADELRASLKQATDQLHSEIKTLLTPQQRDRFERRLQNQNRRRQRNAGAGVVL